MNAQTLRRLTYGWCAVIALAGWMAYSQLFGSVVTTLVCDRTADTCTLSGGTQRKVPGPSQIHHAELRHHIEHRVGEVYDIYLDEQSIDPQSARSDESVASYRAAALAIDGFLRDPKQAHLEVSFTYWATLREKITSAGIFAGTLAVLAFLIIMLRRQRGADAA
jgi:hypothetical protein